MALALQVLIVGLAAGAGYGLVGMAYSLVYRLTGVVHFALGELTTLTIFATLWLSAGTGPVTRTNVPQARFVVALVSGLLLAVAAGMVVYVVAVRPFVGKGREAGWIGATVAVAFATRGVVSALFVRESYVFPDPFRFDRLPNGGILGLGGGVSLPVRTFFVLGAGVAVAIAAGAILSRTRWGRALQAIVQDREGALVVGLPVDRLLAGAFGLAGLLAAVAALVATPSTPVTVQTGALLGLQGLAATLLGGFGSPRRVFVAGLAVGVIQAGVASLHLGGLSLGPAYRDLVPLALAIGAMVVRRGLQRPGFAKPPLADRRRPGVSRPAPSGRTAARVSAASDSRAARPAPRARGGRERTSPTEAVARSPRLVALEVRRAAADARRSWGWRAWASTAALAAVAMAPFVFSDARVTAMAAGLLTMLAATGLNATFGIAGMPSLAQGAFMGLGAFTVAWLRVRHGWDPGLGVAAAVIVTMAAGLLVGRGVAGLRPAFVAVVTWLGAWLLVIGLLAFPAVSGGAQGLAVGQPVLHIPLAGLALRIGPAMQFELALALVALALLGFWSLKRTPAGLATSALRQAPAAARALGVNSDQLRLGAFVASAAVAGLAGALIVQVTGIADATAFGPLLSVELLVAVLLGGAGRTLGPVIGVALLGVIPHVAGPLGSAFGLGPERFEPIMAALLLVAALALAPGGGLVGWFDAAARRRGPLSAGGRSTDEDRGDPSQRPPIGRRPDLSGQPVLAVQGMAKRFGGVTALDDASLAVEAGEIHALIGPNGSGKTTLIRVVAGEVTPDQGQTFLLGRDVTPLTQRRRVRAGIVQVPARAEVFGELTVLEHVLAGASPRRRAGAMASVLATPRARAERRALADRARRILDVFGLREHEALRVGELHSAHQRLVAVATACACVPRILLLDEPSSGMDRTESSRLARTLSALSDAGLPLLVVEHNLALVRLLARTVTVLDAGRVIAEGSPAQVAADPEVVRVYLGTTAALGPR